MSETSLSLLERFFVSCVEVIDMNIVRTKTGELIHATQIKEDEVYFCPECGEEVTKKVSRNGVVFFSHIPKKHRQEETIAHQEGKHLLLESLKKSWLSCRTRAVCVVY